MTKDIVTGENFMIKGDLMLMLENLEESWEDDHNEKNVLRLSFYVKDDLADAYRNDEDEDIDDTNSFESEWGEWFPLSSGTYLTRLEASAPDHLKRHAMEFFMDELWYSLTKHRRFWRDCLRVTASDIEKSYLNKTK